MSRFYFEKAGERERRVLISTAIILLFGIGTIGKGMIVFTLVVATVLLQTIAGVKNIDPRFLEVSRSLSASRARTLVQVQFPAALSFIVAGIRLAIGRGSRS